MVRLLRQSVAPASDSGDSDLVHLLRCVCHTVNRREKNVLPFYGFFVCHFGLGHQFHHCSLVCTGVSVADFHYNAVNWQVKRRYTVL